MKKYLPGIVGMFVLLTACAQPGNNPGKFNLDFETVTNSMPDGWSSFGGKKGVLALDTVTVLNGKYAALIDTSEEVEVFKAWAYTLPGNYDGKTITLSGYIKTENIEDGFAGLWMRIDPEIAFDNMQSRGITGTTDWTQYEITLSMKPAETEQIVIGGLLVGKGKMWLDNLKVTIDGKDIGSLQPMAAKDLPPALQDTEFDNGSNIIFPEPDEQLITNLELLGRVWGLLKYHHPEVAKGNYNWDYELFRILPFYLKATDSKERDEVLLNWIDKYGKIPPCTDCKEASENSLLKPDRAWIDTSEMNDRLRKKLEEVYRNRYQGTQFYIGMHPGVGNPDFKNEKLYSTMFYPDAGFRLLCVYKYWNMIHYFFPNRHLSDKNWNVVLREYIPVFLTAGNELAYELAALQLIGEIHDTHANLWGGGNKLAERRGHGYAPFRVQFIEKQLVVTDYYNPEKKEEAGLDIGDIITHIDGKRVQDIVDSIRIYYPASNEAARLRDISADMLRSRLGRIEVEFIKPGNKTGKKIIELYPRSQLNMYHWFRVNENEKSYKLLPGKNIGYVTLANIKDEDIPVIKEQFIDTKGIIIDIRNYPSAFTPFTLAPFFVEEDTPFVSFSMGNVNNPGEFNVRHGALIPKQDKTYRGKLVVLVNEITQSSAEYQSMAFRAGRNTTIVGSTTAGADGNVSQISLPGGVSTMISGIGVYYPDGTDTQRVGIVPDVWLEPTIKGIREGRDELLEKAIEIID